MKGVRVTGLLLAGLLLLLGGMAIGLVIWGLNSGFIRVIVKESPGDR